MTSTTDPQLVTAAETARLLGVTRQRALDLAASADDFPAAEPTATGGRVWPRAAVQTWAATHPDPGPIFTGPDVPPDYGHPRQIWAVMNRAASEARLLNHPWIGDEHLVLGMLHPDCPGAARLVLESFGIRPEPFRQALIASMGDPWDSTPTHRTLSPATQLVLERANLEAARIADAEVASEHVLLALISPRPLPAGWIAQAGITADAIRQRVLDATEGVVLPEVAPARTTAALPGPMGTRTRPGTQPPRPRSPPAAPLGFARLRGAAGPATQAGRLGRAVLHRPRRLPGADHRRPTGALRGG